MVLRDSYALRADKRSVPTLLRLTGAMDRKLDRLLIRFTLKKNFQTRSSGPRSTGFLRPGDMPPSRLRSYSAWRYATIREVVTPR
jgi:hypothetical protein